MAKFKVIKPIDAGSGYLIDGKGNSVPMQQLVPKVGSIIEGVISEQYIFNQNLEGISYPITTNIEGQEGNSAIFIPSDSLEEVSADTPTTNDKKPLTNTQKWMILIGVTGVLYFIMYQVNKKN
jgi:hypothetical protein